jgi:hypothetical protein
MRSALLLGFRTLAREWRSGDLAVLFLALFVAVAALTGVGFLADRIERAMQLQASEVLGADLRMWSPDVPDKRYAQEAARRGMRSASVLATMSVVLKGDLTQLSNMRSAPIIPCAAVCARLRWHLASRCQHREFPGPERYGRIRACLPRSMRARATCSRWVPPNCA